MRAMRLCILVSSYKAADDSQHRVSTLFDPRPWLPACDHECEYHLLDKATSVSAVRALAGRGFDAFINLCDGYSHQDAAGIEVVKELERLGVAFTGPGSAFYEPSREDMKRACRAAGIDTPRYVHARSAADLERCLGELRFPLIVKPPQGYDSVGLSRASRIETPEALRTELPRTLASFGGALVEEFIEGREFTVLVAEPREGESEPVAYAPLEIRFPEGESFKHFDLKWSDFDRMSAQTVEDPELAERLKDITRRMFTSMSGSGYGRCDIRMDRQGRLYMLEINEVPCVFYPLKERASADMILLADPRGHRGFLAHIIDCAQRRQRRQSSGQ
jgi:D-alanine-D-alanine ligase